MKKVILVAPLSGISGGIRNWAHNILSYYSLLSCPEVEFVTFDFSRRTNGQLKKNALLGFLSCVMEYMPLINNAAKLIKNSDAEIVYITTPASFLLIKDLLLIRIAHRSGKKVIMHYHFGRIPNLFTSNSVELYLLKKVLRTADRNVVMDIKSTEVLNNAGFYNVRCIPNPVSDSILSKTENIIVPREKNYILFVGDVVETKGVRQLISACRGMRGIHLRIIGRVSDNYKSELISLAGTELSGCLEICGESDFDSVIREMQKCDIFVLPSHTEGFPNVILESMSCGCAIVSTEVGAIPQMLNVCSPGNECGIVVKPKDEVQLQRAIEKMLYDENYANRCRQNARLRVKSLYSIKTVWPKIVDTFAF